MAVSGAEMSRAGGSGAGTAGGMAVGAALVGGLGGVMRQLRLARGLTLEELASRVGCVKGYLSAIERGKRPPPQADLAARLERELAAPADLFVRAAAWHRTPERIRAELSREAGEIAWLKGVPGFEDARCAAVLIQESTIERVRQGDVAILGPCVEPDAFRHGWVIAVESRDGTVDFVQWPSMSEHSGPAVYRRVLGVCRAF